MEHRRRRTVFRDQIVGRGSNGTDPTEFFERPSYKRGFPHSQRTEKENGVADFRAANQLRAQASGGALVGQFEDFFQLVFKVLQLRTDLDRLPVVAVGIDEVHDHAARCFVQIAFHILARRTKNRTKPRQIRRLHPDDGVLERDDRRRIVPMPNRMNSQSFVA